MAYQRNGFLEGIDAATKLIGIYNGFQDRQDAREWKQKEWDYKVDQDKKAWDFKDRQQDHIEKHQTASLNETIRTHRANEGIAAGHLNLARAKYNDILRKEREQERSEAMFISGYNGDDSGITGKDIGNLPYAIKGSFNGLGNYAAQKFGLSAPEGASPNGVFGLLDDKKGNVIIGYLDNANGQKRVHTVGEAMTRDQAVNALKESGASDEHINILLGNETKQEPTEAALTKGIDFSRLEFLKSQRAQNGTFSANNSSKQRIIDHLDSQIAAEQAKIDAQKQHNLEEFNKDQAETDAKERQYTADINKAIVDGELADVSERKNLARLDTLMSAYPGASNETKKLILEEAAAIRSGLSSGLSGPELVHQHRKDKQIKEAQTKGLLSGIEAHSKDRYMTHMEYSDDLAKSDDINKFTKSIGDDVGKHFDAKSGKRGEASNNATKASAFISDSYGGITNKLINSLEHKAQVTDLTLTMTRLGTKDPATALYFLQRDGGGSSSVDETEINAVKSVFAAARKYGAEHRYSDQEMNVILRVVTDKMVKEGISIHKFEDVFNDVVGAKRGDDD